MANKVTMHIIIIFQIVIWGSGNKNHEKILNVLVSSSLKLRYVHYGMFSLFWYFTGMCGIFVVVFSLWYVTMHELHVECV